MVTISGNASSVGRSLCVGQTAGGTKGEILISIRDFKSNLWLSVTSGIMIVLTLNSQPPNLCLQPTHYYLLTFLTLYNQPCAAENIILQQVCKMPEDAGLESVVENTLSTSDQPPYDSCKLPLCACWKNLT